MQYDTVSFPPRLRRAAAVAAASVVRPHTRVSPPARKIARNINIRAKYLPALLQACPCARDTRGAEVERRTAVRRRAHVTRTRIRTVYETLLSSLRGPGTPRSGDYTAAKLQCLATHNAATETAAMVIMLVLTAR